MHISIIGTGNLGYHLTRAFAKGGHKLTIWNHSLEKAQLTANDTGANICLNLSALPKSVDICFICVNEEALPEVLSQIPSHQFCLVHTAGSLSINILENFAKQYGVFYPLQSFLFNKPIDYSNIPVFIEASDYQTLHKLEVLAQFHFGKAIHLDSDKRALLHIAAVFSSNFTNAMCLLAEQILEENSLDFDYLRPLIQETLSRIQKLRPHQTLTGPAARKSNLIIQKHLTILKNHPFRYEIYNLISNFIKQQNLKP